MTCEFMVGDKVQLEGTIVRISESRMDVCFYGDEGNYNSIPTGAMAHATLISLEDEAERAAAAAGGKFVKQEESLSRYDWSKVPEECDWVATDKDGAVYAYAVTPTLGNRMWKPVRGDKGRGMYYSRPCNRWRESLEQRPVEKKIMGLLRRQSMPSKGTLILLALITGCVALIISGHRDTGGWFGFMAITWLFIGGVAGKLPRPSGRSFPLHPEGSGHAN